MYAIRIIWQREMSQYFRSPLAYLIASAFLLLTGISFNTDLLLSIGIKPVNPALIPDLLALVMVLISPLLTMRLLAEESREGTMELLLTAPISDMAIVLGKFLSAWSYFTFLLLLTGVYQVILVTIAFPDLAHTIGAYLGIWLYGGATLAIGLLFSAMTENQIIAAFLSTITLLVLYFGESVGQIIMNADIAQFIFSITLQGHYIPSFSVGIVRGEDIIYYSGVIVINLFITMQLVRSRRWR